MVGRDTQMGSLQVRWRASVIWVKRKAAVKSRRVHVEARRREATRSDNGPLVSMLWKGTCHHQENV